MQKLGTDLLRQARQIAASYLQESQRGFEADVVLRGGGDDFQEVQVAVRALAATASRLDLLERALHCYADEAFWDGEIAEATLSFHDQGDVARAALDGKEFYAHRD